MPTEDRTNTCENIHTIERRKKKTVREEPHKYNAEQ